jgi:23S rRNA pseudouridine1911/1915/1917 synthase
MKTFETTVTDSENNKPLIEFVADRLNISKKKAKKKIDSRCVFVNNKRVWIAKHILQTADVVNLPFPGSGNTRISVLFEDDFFVIVNKPPGYISKGGKESIEQKIKNDFQYDFLSAVHRIDKDTSGVLVLAKSDRAVRQSGLMFANRQVKKIYSAILKGSLHEKEFTISEPLAGQQAVSHVNVLDTNQHVSYVCVSIETGRTHQIRKHFALMHCPVLGDKIYAGSADVLDTEKSVFRHMLHSRQIIFEHPVTQKTVNCIAPLFSDFTDCLEILHLKQ